MARKAAVLLFFLFLPAGHWFASAQELSAPIVEIPSSSLAPPEQALPSLPPAASNLLAPTTTDQAPADDLGANLQSTSFSPFMSTAAGDHPAAEVDTVVRGVPQLGPRSQGAPAPAMRWSTSAPGASMKGVQSSSFLPAPAASSWKTSSVPSPGALDAPGTAVPAALAKRANLAAGARKPRIVARAAGSSSSQADASSIFGFTPGTPETQAEFGQNPFSSLGGYQESFLRPDLTTVNTHRRRSSGPRTVAGVPTSEMERLQAELHPPGYLGRYGKKNAHTRVTMKSLIEQESQTDPNAPILPPIFFIPQ